MIKYPKDTNYFIILPNSYNLTQDIISELFVIVRTYNDYAFVIKSHLEIDEVVELINNNIVSKYDIYRLSEYSDNYVLE